MSEIPKALSASELRDLRVKMKQNPRSMAKLLDVDLPRYYRWERKGGATQTVALAMHFLALQSLPDEAPRLRRTNQPFRQRYKPGTRVGRLVVLNFVEQPSGMNLRIAVQCDCGVAKTWQVSMLSKARQCSASCALAKEPFPPDAPPPTPELEPGLD